MSRPIPKIQTNRLLLRAFEQEDARVVQWLAGAPEVALTTQHIPHPYEEGVAETWIASHQPSWESGGYLTLAVTTESDGVVGAVGLHINHAHRRGELGYWIGVPFWGRGFATEASRAVVRFGFEELDLNRIQARHMVRNPASGRVMVKIGMKLEGVLREHAMIRGRFEDTAMHAILRADLEGSQDLQGQRRVSRS